MNGLFNAGGLKTDAVDIDSIGMRIEIQELTLKARAELVRLTKDGDNSMVSAVVAKHGVIDLADHEIDEIAEKMSPAVLEEIMSHVLKLSGIDAEEDDVKN